jgi:rod shape-determining protein MreC
MTGLLRFLSQWCIWGRGILPFVSALVLCTILLNLNQQQKRSFFEAATSSVLFPAQSVVLWVKEIKSLSDQNIKLVQDNARLKFALEQRMQAEIENLRLREFLSFPKKMDHPIQLAEVVARDPNRLHSSVVINLGNRDSIKKDMPIFTAKGVVGKISKVFWNHSHVQLMQALSSKISILEKKSRTMGILESLNGHDLVVNIPNHSNLRVGDTLVTSGFGGVYPKGMSIGIIEKFQDGPIPVLEQAFVKPFQNPNYLEEVFVLKRQAIWKLEKTNE